MSADERINDDGTIALPVPHGVSERLRLTPLDSLSRHSVATSDRLHARTPGQFEEFLLRGVNLVVAIAALLVLLPLILVVGLLIRLDSPGPIIYRQLRIGVDRRNRIDAHDSTGRRVNDLGGSPFVIYKFRTMRNDAERNSGPVWATKNDARATRVGAWLRRTRLDEVPQFWNVLTGDMSVVGPRPERPSFVLDLQKKIDGYRLRNRVKPGITGWAQIHKPSDLTLEDVREKIGYDLEYVRRRSLWFDLLIMLRTLPVMLEQENNGEAKEDRPAKKAQRPRVR